MELLDQFSLEHLHLDDFILLLPDHLLFLLYSLVQLDLSIHLYLLVELLLHQLGYSFLLFDDVVLLGVLVVDLAVDHVLLLPVLHCYYLRLLCFLFLAQVDSLLDLLLFEFSLSAHLVDLVLVLMHHLLLHLLGLQLLLHLVVVLLLQNHDLIRPLLPVSYTHLTLPTICSV